jgi:hypothetical protein
VRRPRYLYHEDEDRPNLPGEGANEGKGSATVQLRTPPSDCDRDGMEGKLLDREHISGVARREIDG